jgi:hypothetical protein
MECINKDLIEKTLKMRDAANRQRWKTATLLEVILSESSSVVGYKTRHKS